MKISVYEVKIKIFVMTNISAEEIRRELTKYIDSGLAGTSKFAELHRENRYKYYSYDSLYPLEKDKVYKKDQIYTLTIRTLDAKLAKHFSEYVVNIYTDKLRHLDKGSRRRPVAYGSSRQGGQLLGARLRSLRSLLRDLLRPRRG